MIRSFTAYTLEVDEAADAIAELDAQLALSGQLLQSTVGILHCYSDFLDTGVAQSICAHYPFPIVGATTLASAVPNGMGEIALSLLVLTSDDVSFVPGATGAILNDDEAPLREAYAAAAAQRPGEAPALMLSFAPLLLNVGGDFFCRVINDASGGVPNFGTITVDHNVDYHDAQVIHDGQAFRDHYAFVLVYGDVQPRFYIANISDEKVFSEKGVVTGVRGNQLQTVGGVSVLEYLQSLGLQKNEEGTITGVNSFPFIVDYRDGTQPVVRVMFAITPEGYAVCGGDIPMGAVLSVGSIDADEVLSGTGRLIDRVLEGPAPNLLLMYSCVGRFFAQGYDPTREIARVFGALGGRDIPYMMAYSGGELCPVYGEAGETANRNHNDTFIVCAL